MLKLTGNQSRTVELADGASIDLAPATPRIMAAGRRAVREAMDSDADLAPDIAALIFTEGVLVEAITGWKGIGDADGKAVALSPETVLQVLADPYIFGKLEAEYVHPISRREMEKNASAVSSAGTSAAATAGKTTAGSRAATKRRRKGQPTAANTPKTRNPKQGGA